MSQTSSGNPYSINCKIEPVVVYFNIQRSHDETNTARMLVFNQVLENLWWQDFRSLGLLHDELNSQDHGV